LSEVTSTEGSIVTEYSSAGGDEGLRKEESKESVGLLIAAILVMIVLCGLFSYLIYRERERKLDEEKPQRWLKAMPERDV
jgi:ABC-type transport system involved in multi-copper enzyme maturation permease subunit